MQTRSLTTPARFAMGLLAGSLTGGLLVGLFYLVTVLISMRTGNAPIMEAVGWSSLPILAIVLAATIGVWLIGILFVATPLWWLLGRLGQRNGLLAVILGTVLPFAIVLGFETQWFDLAGGEADFSVWDTGGEIIENGHVTPYGWQKGIEAAGVLGVIGAVVGYLVWRTAYVCRWLERS